MSVVVVMLVPLNDEEHLLHHTKQQSNLLLMVYSKPSKSLVLLIHCQLWTVYMRRQIEWQIY